MISKKGLTENLERKRSKTYGGDISLHFKQHICGHFTTDLDLDLGYRDITRGECYDIETKLSRKPKAVKKNSTPLAKWPISPDRAIPRHYICNQM